MNTLFKSSEELQSDRQKRLLDIFNETKINENGKEIKNTTYIGTVFSDQNIETRTELNDYNFNISSDLRSELRATLNSEAGAIGATAEFLNKAYAAKANGKNVDSHYLSALEKNILTASNGTQYYSKESGKIESTPDISSMTQSQKDSLNQEQKSAIANFEYIREGSYTQRLKAEVFNTPIEDYMTTDQLEAFNSMRYPSTGSTAYTAEAYNQDSIIKFKMDAYEQKFGDELRKSFDTSFKETGKASLETMVHYGMLGDSYTDSGTWTANLSTNPLGVQTMNSFVAIDSLTNTIGVGIYSTQWMGSNISGRETLDYDLNISAYAKLLNGGIETPNATIMDQLTAVKNTDFPLVIMEEGALGIYETKQPAIYDLMLKFIEVSAPSGQTLVEATEEYSLASIISDKFTQAATQRYGDPLVVDLDRDGKLETTSADGSVLFDHDNDGQATGTGWVNAEDGLLVRDKNLDGQITSGRELFGDNTIKSDGTKAVDGFDALSDLDSNSDGVFNEQDSAFSEVKVWQDADQDGVTDQGELLSLAEAGISSIDLNAKTVNQSVAGGILRKTSTATTTDDGTTAVGAMDFAENKFYSKFEDVLETSQELQNSINVAGQGALRSLHESANLSPGLKELLSGLYSGETPVTDNAIHEVLLEWARTSQNFETSLDILDGVTLDDGTQINVGISDRVRTVIEKTAVLESLNGSRILEYNIRDNGSTYTINAKTGTETFWDTRTVAKGGTTTTGDWFFHRLADNARATNISQGYASAFNSIKESIETSHFVKEVYPVLLENLSFELGSVA
ncbi:hypothetical protein [Francisella uliginis]|uniref:hypothetical protein n=1 Tax=Francisella uliginis TaxID=573570 RepID=UPI000B2985E8|nr:hypothetical protein [Francisella uliginis]